MNRRTFLKLAVTSLPAFKLAEKLAASEVVKIKSITPGMEITDGPSDPYYQALKEDIRKQGQISPILIDPRTNTILDGYQRFCALKQLGHSKIFVSRAFL